MDSFSHPPEQRIPTTEKLHNWYKDIIYRANGEGIVTGMSTLFQEYLNGAYNRG